MGSDFNFLSNFRNCDIKTFQINKIDRLLRCICFVFFD